MERLGRPAKKGLSKNQLLFWGVMFLLIGVFSRSFLQNRVLRMDSTNAQQLLDAISASRSAMAAATAAIVMQALETCALPIFAFLLTDGFEKSKNRKKMALYLAITAIVSELPYNFAVSGKLLHTTSRNPAVAMLIGLIVIWFFCHYEGKTVKNVFIRIVVGLASLLWAAMLGIEHGAALLVMIMTMWAFRNNKPMRSLFGAVMAAACTLFSPFYALSAMGILPVHLCREEEEEPQKPILRYGFYPVLLLTMGLLSHFL